MDTLEARTPNGRPLAFTVRQDTNDGALAFGLLHEDEYRLKGRHLTGWAIDVGAHIGSVAVALAVDNWQLRVLAIEAVASNAELVLENAERNGVADRIVVITRAASAPGRKTEKILTEFSGYDTTIIDEGYVWGSRFVGNMLTGGGTTTKVKAIDLDAAIALTGAERISLLKIDCEGCEYQFLRSPALAKVDTIVGEYHDNGTYDQLKGLLDATHRITYRKGDPIGIFEAVAL